MNSDINFQENTQSDQPGELDNDDGPLLQSFRVRCGAVLADSFNWRLMESEFRFVLYSGIVIWAIFILSI
jgi:hypothetical protein